MAKAILRELARFQAQERFPFTFYTEASLNLAADDELVLAMREAGFTSVFIGIETTNAAALAKANKKQNLGVDVRASVEKLTAAGLEVMAGFIVGFDGDGPESFDTQRELLKEAPLPLAMMGLLMALPSTALWRRLESEGRLRAHSDGETFARPNFSPAMSEHDLVAGYAKLLADLYAPAAYFHRAEALVDRLGAPAHEGPLLLDDVRVALRAVVRLGAFGARRGHFWRLIARALPRGVHAVRTAIACAVRGEHMIRYTDDVVLPRLARALREVDGSPTLLAAAAPA